MFVSKNISFLNQVVFLLVAFMCFMGIAMCGFGETINGDLVISTNRTVGGELIVTGNLTINKGVTLTINSGAVVTVSGDVTNNGTLTIVDNQTDEDAYSHLSALKNFTNTGTINLSGGSLVVGSLENEKLVEGTGNMYLNAGSVNFKVNNSYLLVRNDLIQEKNTKISVATGVKNCSLVVQNQYSDYFGTPPTQNFDRNPWYISLSKKDNGKVDAIEFKSAIEDFLYVNHYLPNGQNDKDVDKAYLIKALGLGKNETTGNGKLEKYVEELIENGVDKEMIEEIVKEISEILPIELTYFTVSQKGQDIVFEWETASETNNDFFTIEYSIDGINFHELTTIAGSGTTSEATSYNYVWNADESGLFYFRLKQTDYNGEFSYSKVVALNFDKETIQGIYFQNGKIRYNGNPLRL